MYQLPRLHALLRDRRDWRATLRGFVIDAAGDLRLRPLPGGDGVDLPPPFTPDPSGLAIAPCGEAILSDAAAGLIRILYPEGSEAELTGVHTPMGLALWGDRIAVSDGAGRVPLYTLPGFHRRSEIEVSGQPAGISFDRQGRLVVVDRSAQSVRRFLSNGDPDQDFDSAAAAGGWVDPAFVTVGQEGMILVTDLGREAVEALGDTGARLGPLELPPDLASPGALLAIEDVLYVADRESGQIWAMEAETAHWLGPLTGWRGPVAAIAVAPDGALWIKPGAGPQVHRLAPDISVSATGVIEAGPFDAGLESGWARVDVEADLSGDAEILVETGLGPEADPLAAAWSAVPGLRAALDLAGPVEVENRRFARLRVEVRRGNTTLGPVLRQVMLATAGERMLDMLPRVFGREDGALTDAPEQSPRALLRRFLDLLGSDLETSNRRLDSLAQDLTVAFARPDVLESLADWLAFDLPDWADSDERRELLARAIHIHARRGTPASIREHGRLYGGADVTLTEAFRERAIWLLDDNSSLGFDTMLPPVDPAGLVLSGTLPAEIPRPNGGARSPCPTEIGHAVVGETMPLPEADIFEPLFSEWAHRFTAHAGPTADAAQLTPVVLAERPAHTDAQVCITRAGVHVGVEATVGMTVLADHAPAGALGSTRLDRDLVLAPADAEDARKGIGQIGTARLGVDSGLG